MTNQKSCPYCDVPVQPRWRDQSFFYCSKCQLLIRNTDFSTEKLKRLYTNSWEQPYQKVDETGGTSSLLSQLYIDRLLKTLGKSNFYGLRILDFGAGRGDLSVAAKNNGANVVAVEPYGYDFLKDRGFTVFKSLEGLKEQPQFHGIITVNVVEHLTSPWVELSQLRQLLSPGGWIFIATPNYASLNAKVMGASWREAQRQGHLYLFNATALFKMLKNCGYTDTQWLRWYFPYDNRLIKKIKDWLLQSVRLDGELKFLAFNKNI